MVERLISSMWGEMWRKRQNSLNFSVKCSNLASTDLTGQKSKISINPTNAFARKCFPAPRCMLCQIGSKELGTSRRVNHRIFQDCWCLGPWLNTFHGWGPTWGHRKIFIRICHLSPITCGLLACQAHVANAFCRRPAGCRSRHVTEGPEHPPNFG